MKGTLRQSRPGLGLALVALAIGGGCVGNDATGYNDSDYDADGVVDAGLPDDVWSEQTPADLSPPAASPNFVFVANRIASTLALVELSGTALRISSVRVGAGPTQVIAHRESDVAVVLNEDSASVTRVRVLSDDARDVATVEVVAGANRLALSPTAAHAIAWSAPAGGLAATLSEISVVSLGGEVLSAARISVGAGVDRVAFASDGRSALIATGQGVSRVSLADPVMDGFAPPFPTEPAGALLPDDALVVTSTIAGVAVVDLATGVSEIVLADVVATDIEPTGIGAQVVVAQGTDALLLVDARARTFTELGVGAEVDTLAIDEHGTAVAGFTLGTGNDVAVVDVVARSAWVARLRKPVVAVWFAPGGRALVAQHARVDLDIEPGLTEDELVARMHAVSVLQLDTQTSKLIALDGPAIQLAFAADHAFVRTGASSQSASAVTGVDLGSLRVRGVTPLRDPLHIGAMPGRSMLFVTQRHALGRIAFVDVGTWSVREITGFELNAYID